MPSLSVIDLAMFSLEKTLMDYEAVYSSALGRLAAGAMDGGGAERTARRELL